MNGNDIIALGLGLEKPWEITGQSLNTECTPHELRITLAAPRGSSFPCPDCGAMCKAHDFKEMTWRHLNFFQHHCYITAAVPRVNCKDHGVKRITVPWARTGSKFTLLFEQAGLMLVREMPVLAAARIMEIPDKTLWRIVLHYVTAGLAQLDLSELKAVGLDETSAKKRHNYVTVFIDLDRRKEPVVFAVPGKGQDVIRQFKQFLTTQGGAAGNIKEVACDMSKPFLSGIKQSFPRAQVTVDWFHVVQTFTKAVNKVRVLEARKKQLPRTTRWAVLKNEESTGLSEQERQALAELNAMDFFTAIAWRVKERLRWVRKASTAQAAKWRLSNFLLCMAEANLTKSPLLRPVIAAIETVIRHRRAIESRWESGHSTARLEGLNSIFQAAKARARGYRNPQTFISMIYLLASPVGNLLKST
ncbi:ISL3 family transposase [Desulfofustis limnaeus]|uniref:ISL3 family transposase n=1 Tax=Desulfofustis limnaeus TaxID=2740163 RepID=A0ABN6M6F5_9BACT|nr:ISL3 family transposase [Desulfofustis limnaeus]BDD85985.1 ISL3 family transposase [Desulfofustis limnaeus]BDD87010.1 ISL3 family transposase [Desulfofustis limnaeus]BDD87017.1 ISL3 family transposase [Desulfofustis limnaeus]BDD87022.1 ISL3 family transposase [Desulfofustis limnaeus]BDD87023.1 ISL3 family transposase [Desulfofustis limnaeus]